MRKQCSLRQQYISVVNKWVNNKKYGYPLDTKGMAKLPTLQLLIDEDYYDGCLTDTQIVCFDELSVGREDDVCYKDTSGYADWVLANPTCQSYESWEIAVNRACEALNITAQVTSLNGCIDLQGVIKDLCATDMTLDADAVECLILDSLVTQALKTK